MIDKLIKTTIIIFFLLFPLFYLSITPDSYEYNKMMLLIITTLVLLLLFSLKIAKERRLLLCKSTFGLPLFLLVILITVSTFIQSPNRVIAFTTPLGPTAWIGGFLFYLLLIQSLIDKKRDLNIYEGVTPFAYAQGKRAPAPSEVEGAGPVNYNNALDQLMTILILDAAFLSLFVICLYTGIFPKNSFTPAGNLLSTTLFIAIMAVYTILHIGQRTRNIEQESKTEKGVVSEINFRGEGKNFAEAAGEAIASDLEMMDGKESIRERIADSKNFLPDPSENTNITGMTDILHSLLPYLLSLFLMLTALIFLIIHLTADQKPTLLPFYFGWSIFLEILKNGKTLLLGIGPTNFVTAFTLVKPLGINQTSVWNIVFTSSSSLLLTLATETGIVAVFFYLVILLKSLKLLKSPISLHSQPTTYNLQPLRLSLLFLLILQTLFPSGMTVFILTIVLLALGAESTKIKEVDLKKFGLLNYLFPGLVIIFAGMIFYFGTRAYLAEVYFKKSLDSLLNNQTKQAYNFQSTAIDLNPYTDRYHLAFSQVSLSIANALSSQKELTDEDKQSIPRLVQQAIDHARSAVALYRTNVVNLDNLAKTYIALLNFADGARDWAEAVLLQRIRLDPFSAGSYLALGRFYQAQEKYDLAEKHFRNALTLKNDLAISHYQLGLLFIKEKKYEDAYRELQTTKAWLSPDSEDSKKVDAQLAELSNLLPKEVTSVATPTPASTANQSLEETIAPTVSE